MEFCYWQILSDVDTIVGGVLSTCSALLTGLALYRLVGYLRSKHELEAQRNTEIIIWKIPFWGVTHLAKLLFGVLAYQLRLKQDTKQLELFSRVFCPLDSASTVLLHGILLLLPYGWIQNMLGEVAKNHLELKVTKYVLLIRVIKYYMMARYVMYVGLFIAELVSQQPQVLCRVINIAIICESSACVILLFVSLSFLLTNFRYFNASDSEKAELLREFLYISLFCIARFMINMEFIVINPEDTCSLNQPSAIHTVIYLGLGVVCTHFIPIYLIMRLFRLETQQEQLLSSNLTGERTTESNLH